MRKTKFTFWLLGLGCGITLTGIVATFIALNVETGTLDQQVLATESQQLTDGEIGKSQEDINTSDEALTNHSMTDVEVQIAENPVYKEITIPKAQSAEEICVLLEQAGLVDQADNFLTYIRECKKQRYLKQGKLVIQQGLSYEELLKELTI